MKRIDHPAKEITDGINAAISHSRILAMAGAALLGTIMTVAPTMSQTTAADPFPIFANCGPGAGDRTFFRFDEGKGTLPDDYGVDALMGFLTAWRHVEAPVVIHASMSWPEAKQTPPNVAQRRAEALRDALVRLGIPADRIWIRWVESSDVEDRGRFYDNVQRFASARTFGVRELCASLVRRTMLEWFDRNCRPRVDASNERECDDGWRRLLRNW